jgi:hypothetical protein
MIITQEYIIKEIISCKKSPIYFIKTYLKILHPIKGIIPLELYDFQEDCIISFVKNREVIVLKSRQIGLSTISTAFCVWLAIFANSKNILLLSNKGKTATNLVSMCKVYIENLPEWLKPNILVNNRQSIEFQNGSKISASTTTDDAGRSEALSLLIIDEAAIISNMETIWTSIKPTLSTGGKLIILSTPLGTGTWYHKKWVEAESGITQEGNKSSLFPVRLPWFVHPERNNEWRDYQKSTMSLKQWAQEFDCSFEKSGNTVIDFDTIDFYEKNQVKDPIEKIGFDHNLWVWTQPQPNFNYIISGDVARGDGGDFCAAHVICVETMEQVAEYKGKITPDIFAYLLESLGKKYNTALIACENNSMGWATVQKLLDLDYQKLYYSQKANVEFIKNTDWEKNLTDKIAGFSTTLKTRPLLINVFEECLRTKSFIFHSQRLLDEIKVFIYNEKGKAEALKGYNDDLIMSCGIALFVRNTTMKLGNITKAGVNLMINSLDSITVEDSTLSSLMVNISDNRKNPHLSADGTIDFRQFLW